MGIWLFFFIVACIGCGYQWWVNITKRNARLNKQKKEWLCKCGHLNKNAGTVCGKCWNERPLTTNSSTLQDASKGGASNSSGSSASGWKQNVDPKTQKTYYFNSISRKTSWLRPISLNTTDTQIPTTTAQIDSKLTIRVGGCSCRGADPTDQKINQDRVAVHDNFAGKPHQVFLGVFDGHGALGHEVAQYVTEHLPSAFKQHESKLETPSELGALAFEECNKNLFASEIDISQAGSTASVCIVDQRKFFVYHVGDSRVVSVSKIDGKTEAKALTADHKPNSPEERERIEKAGGTITVQSNGASRVWRAGGGGPGLAVSRAFGDKLVATSGVIAQPDFIAQEITPSTVALILASDGVWEFISTEAAANIIAGHSDPLAAAKALVEEAGERWATEEEDGRDDISAIVVFFDHGS